MRGAFMIKCAQDDEESQQSVVTSEFTTIVEIRAEA
jgi:hypothetical protein